MASGNGVALLVVDVQQGAVDRGPWRAAELMGNIASLIAACRGSGVEVVYVQHDGKPGEDEEPGTPGWEIAADIRPGPGERVVRKRFNSAFRETDLRAYLEDRGVGTLLVVGIQTEYCVDTTIRVAFEHGFEVVVPEMTNSTFDSGGLTAAQIHHLINRRILAGRFARAMSLEETRSLVAEAGRGRQAMRGGERHPCCDQGI